MSSESDPTSRISDEDNRLLYVIARATTQDVVGIIWETLFLSAYGVFFVVALWTILRKGLKTTGSIIMLLIVVYLYTTSLTLWALNVSFWFKRTRAIFMDYPAGLSLTERVVRGNTLIRPLGTPMEALFMFNMIVGDSVVIWRVWAIYARSRWVVLLPSLMLTMSFIFTVINTICLTGAGFSNQSALANGGGVCNKAELISWAFSLVTNAVCTLLIGVKAWQHRKATRAMASSLNSSGRMTTNRILSLLVESGFIYCLFWLTQYILFADIARDKPAIYAYELFSGMGDQISGMYPTLIIVIVNLHGTIWDDDSSTSTTTARKSQLRFNSAFTTDDGRSAGYGRESESTDVTRTGGMFNFDGDGTSSGGGVSQRRAIQKPESASASRSDGYGEGMALSVVGGDRDRDGKREYSTDDEAHNHV
ncbi:hypothetical protein R3P38DRAFT_2838595 [Favolaschia claudopus]|uniref:Uncharacterized protein n=1 Tax=Favolaschia claudopus TaxID=2862362 RepID=A0AAW0E6Z3_9AGAR